MDSSGHLESPNYPDDYQPNKLCIWRLTVPQVAYEICQSRFIKYNVIRNACNIHFRCKVVSSLTPHVIINITI